MKTNLRSTKRGFSLVELLVALSILAVVAAIIVPKFLNVRTQAAQTAAAAQFKALKESYNQYLSLGGAGSTVAGDVMQYLATAATLGTPRTTLGTMTDSSGNFGSTVVGLSGITFIPSTTVTAANVATLAQGWYISGAAGAAASTAYYCDGNGSGWQVGTTAAGVVTATAIGSSPALAF